MNHNETLIQIEDLMLDLCSGKYHWLNADHELQYYRQAASHIYDPDVEYSPMLQRYFDLVGLNQIKRYNQALFLSEDDFLDFCNDLTVQHNQFIHRHQRQRKRNALALEEGFTELLNRHRKLLIVRVDLSYLRETDMSVRQFDADLKKLRIRIQDRDTCFKELLDYYWAIEQGRDKGYHCHLLLIYDGSKHCKDEHYGKQAGKVWQDITGHDGYYFNCNSKEHKDTFRQYDTLGIGMIHRRNEREATNALRVIGYLAKPDKTDQYLRARIQGMRCFG